MTENRTFQSISQLVRQSINQSIKSYSLPGLHRTGLAW